jgi:hypothetical protein
MNLKLQLELLWWLITATIVFVIMYPISRDYPSFNHFYKNILFIVCFVTFTRYIFFLQYTFLAQAQVVKVGLILISILAISSIVLQMNEFQREAANYNIDDLLKTVAQPKREKLWSYIKSEIVFFAMGSIIAGIILPIRLVISIWRVKNTGKV